MARTGTAGPHGEDPANAAALDVLAGFDHRRAENFRFRVAVQNSRRLDGIEHRFRFMAVARERLGADDMLARPGALDRQIIVKVIRHAEND